MSACTFLEWDTTFFEKRIARVNGNHLTRDHVIEIERYCERNQIDCVYFLADADDDETARLAERHDFLLVDVRVTLDKTLDSTAAMPSNVRAAVEADIPDLAAMTRSAFTASRFYHDPYFSKERCDQLYEIWVSRAFEGFAEQMLVPVMQDEPVGFITCHKRSAGGEIGLLGVRQDMRGQGIGSTMIDAAEAWFVSQEISDVFVVTQGRNISAQRLYQKHGYRTKSVEYWYHRWFSL